jgi:hypothetical protein
MDAFQIFAAATAVVASLFFFRNLAAWAGSMAWHLWRIATFRARFDLMSDTGMTIGSFLVVYLLTGIARHSYVIGHAQPASVFLGLTFMYLVWLFAFERSHRSSTLVAALAGASAASDILQMALALTGWAALERKVDGPLGLGAIYEVALYAGCVWQFFKSTPAVQASGYRRSACADPVDVVTDVSPK